MGNIDLIYKEAMRVAKEFDSSVFAVFDFDNTCIFNDITEATLHYLSKNNLLKDRNLLGEGFALLPSEAYSEAVFNHYYKLLDAKQVKGAYEFIGTILSGFSVDEIGLLMKNVTDFEGSEITDYQLFGRKIAKGIKPREQVVTLIEILKRGGIKVWFVTASLEALVKEYLKNLILDVDVIGVKPIIVGRKFTTQLEKPLPIIEGKVECIKKRIDATKIPVLGVGDSMNDLPMLEYCETKAIVDHGNTLTSKAKENNWFII